MENDARADAYEAERDRNLLEIEKRVEELGLRTCATDLRKTCQPKKRGAKRKRKTPDATERRTSARLMALDKEVPTDTLAEDEAADVHVNANEGEEKDVRKITTMKSIRGRQNKPKLKLEINDIGQPIGASATRFANFIGTQVRTKGFPVEYDDWRKVPLLLKLGLWTEVKLFWDVDQDVFEWYIKTAHIKWKEFKADLKKDYFDNELEYDKLEYDALIKSCDDRVDPDQWKKLVDHWMTPEAKVRSIRGKANREKHKQAHTAGCKSFARVDQEMTEKKGRRPRRDELFIETHSSKTGVPHKESAAIIQQLRDKAENFPELLEKSMKEGDLFSHVCGPEKHGYVRTKGLGATPSGLELPGVRTYKSTKLQIETEARRLADQKVDDMSQEMEKMKREMAEMKQMILGPRDSRNTIPHQNTSSPQDNNEEVGNLNDEVESNGSMHSMQNRHAVTEMRRITPTLRQQDQENQMNIRAQEGARKTIGRQVVDDEVQSSAPVRRENPVPQRQNNKLGGGREVILYSITRPLNVPVAKGFFQTLDSHALVGGVPLGAQYSEVVISSVYKKDTVLPRPYEDVVNMGSARGRSIAWPTAMMTDFKNKRNVVPDAGA